MTRPERLVVVTGTGTEVGKTWVGAALIGVLRSRGVTVAARKPAQSFDPSSDEASDASLLAAATGEPVGVVCPPHRSYPVAMAPPMAASALGLAPFTIGTLVAEVSASWPAPPPAMGLVEGAGGVAAPQADDGDTVDLIDALAPDLVVVVAPAGLGAINLIRLCLRALAVPQHPGHPELGCEIPLLGGKAHPSSSGPPRIVVHLNRCDEGNELHVANRRWLAERDGFAVTTSIDDLADLVETYEGR